MVAVVVSRVARQVSHIIHHKLQEDKRHRRIKTCHKRLAMNFMCMRTAIHAEYSLRIVFAILDDSNEQQLRKINRLEYIKCCKIQAAIHVMTLPPVDTAENCYLLRFRFFVGYKCFFTFSYTGLNAARSLRRSFVARSRSELRFVIQCAWLEAKCLYRNFT